MSSNAPRHAAAPTAKTVLRNAIAALLSPFALHEDVVKAAAK